MNAITKDIKRFSLGTSEFDGVVIKVSEVVGAFSILFVFIAELHTIQTLFDSEFRLCRSYDIKVSIKNLCTCIGLLACKTTSLERLFHLFFWLLPKFFYGIDTMQALVILNIAQHCNDVVLHSCFRLHPFQS